MVCATSFPFRFIDDNPRRSPDCRNGSAHAFDSHGSANCRAEANVVAPIGAAQSGPQRFICLFLWNATTMARHDDNFARWIAFEKSTWTFQVFRQYETELERIYYAHRAASRTIYKSLKTAGATWDDDAHKHMAITTKSGNSMFPSIREWSNTYSHFENWTHLNIIVSMTSNLETYLAAVISLAINSDPGLLLGGSKLIDGARLLRHPRKDLSVAIDGAITKITKGDWPSRMSSFHKLFTTVPSFVAAHIGQLDTARLIRNRMSHAFGRDIEASRNHTTKNIIPMEKISKARLLKLKEIIRRSAKEFDRLLLANHIGEYQAVAFFDRLYPTLNLAVHPSQRAIALKKELGRSVAPTRGKKFCKGLVDYYESL